MRYLSVATLLPVVLVNAGVLPVSNQVHSLYKRSLNTNPFDGAVHDLFKASPYWTNIQPELTSLVEIVEEWRGMTAIEGMLATASMALSGSIRAEELEQGSPKMVDQKGMYLLAEMEKDNQTFAIFMRTLFNNDNNNNDNTGNSSVVIEEKEDERISSRNGRALLAEMKKTRCLKIRQVLDRIDALEEMDLKNSTNVAQYWTFVQTFIGAYEIAVTAVTAKIRSTTPKRWEGTPFPATYPSLKRLGVQAKKRAIETYDEKIKQWEVATLLHSLKMQHDFVGEHEKRIHQGAFKELTMKLMPMKNSDNFETLEKMLQVYVGIWSILVVPAECQTGTGVKLTLVGRGSERLQAHTLQFEIAMLQHFAARSQLGPTPVLADPWA